MSMFYSVYISMEGKSSIETCEEYVTNTNGIEINGGKLGIYCNNISLVCIAHTTLNDFLNNIKFEVHIYEKCSIERDSFLGLSLENAIDIHNQINQR